MDPATAQSMPASSGFRDGLGERRRSTDASGDTVDLLCLRRDLTSVPSFEFALRERTSRLAQFRNLNFARVRSIDRLTEPTSTLAVASDYTRGVRLSQLLTPTDRRPVNIDINAALHLLRQTVSAIAMLHEYARDVAHGAIGPERIIVTANARIVIVEYVLGAALEQLRFSETRYWEDLRIAVPQSPGLSRFDQRTDVTQLGVVALSLVLGRLLKDDETADTLGDVLASARAMTTDGDSEPLPGGLRSWIERALQLEGKTPFASAIDARMDLENLLAGDDVVDEDGAHETAATDSSVRFDTASAVAMTDSYGTSKTQQWNEPEPPRYVQPEPPRPVEPDRPSYAEPARPRYIEPEPSRHSDPEPSRYTDPEPLRRTEPEPSRYTEAEPTQQFDLEPARYSEPVTTHSEFDFTPPPRVEAPPSVAPPFPGSRSYTASTEVTPSTSATPAPSVILPPPQPVTPLQPIVAPKPAATPTSTYGISDSSVFTPAPKPEPSRPELEFPFARNNRPEPEFPSARKSGSSGVLFSAATETDEDYAKHFDANDGGSRRWSGIALIAAVVIVLGIGGWFLAKQFFAATSTAASAPSGILSVTSNPAGVQVFVDNESRGVTPLTLNLSPGQHKVELRGDGEPRTVPVTIVAGATTTQYIELAATKMATVGQLQVKSEPAGAQVTVDGIARGKAPVLVDNLAAGDHTVVLDSELGSAKHTVSVEAGVTASLVVPMTGGEGSGLSGWVSLAAPVEVEIYENKKLLGTSLTQKIPIPSGRHELELVNQPLGYRVTTVVQVPAGKTAPIKIEWPKGTIALNAVPWAEVWIDGEKVGETPIGNVSLPIGPHEVTFRNPDLGEQKQAISVALNTPARLSVDLRKKP
jgi:hypothetical protein